MIYVVVATYDTKVSAFSSPFFTRSKSEAVRMFSDAVNDPQTVVHKHPEDYSLFYMGEFSDDDGRFHMPAQGCEQLITARECVSEVTSSK